ncbi:MAG: hypothetical protein IJ064_05865 [Bacteroidaceae bacterium]|nr:hypothetical protein [Bacteroidaceae bacterium]
MTQLTDEDKRVRNILIDVAAKEETITASDLVVKANVPLNMTSPNDRKLLGRILGRIVEYEHESGRPMLSSVIVSKSKVRGDGFFKIAEQLGYGDWQTLKNDGFATKQMNEAYKFWKKH